MSEWNRDRHTGCPCKGCTARSVGCHGSCERYTAWRKELDEKNKARLDYLKSRNTMSDAAIKRLYVRRRKNKKRLHENYEEN